MAFDLGLFEKPSHPMGRENVLGFATFRLAIQIAVKPHFFGAAIVERVYEKPRDGSDRKYLGPMCTESMGIETWLLVSANPDWRWGTVGMSASWYPTMRLFRQKRLGDWGPVVREIAEALSAKGATA